MNIGYLASAYPAPSHTFIKREVEEVRKNQINVKTFSVRKVKLYSQSDSLESENTRYLLPFTFSKTLMVVKFLLLHPLKSLSGLCKSYQHRIKGVKGTVWSVFHWGEALLLAAILNKEKIVHLHIHFSNAACDVGRVAAFMENIPWSLTLHGSADFEGEKRLLLPVKISEAQKVFCVAKYGRASAFRLANSKDWEKIIIGRCGLNLENLNPYIKNEYSEEVDKLKLVVVSRLSPEKGVLGVLQTMKLLHQNKIPFHLKIIGDGKERKNCEDFVRKNTLNAEVEFLGTQWEEEVFKTMQWADVLLLGSFMEGLPVVLMEAGYIGCLCVAPRVAGIPELIEEGENGFLFTPSDWQDFYQKIIQVKSLSLLEKTQYSEKLRNKVIAQHDIEKSTLSKVEYFKSL